VEWPITKKKISSILIIVGVIITTLCSCQASQDHITTNSPTETKNHPSGSHTSKNQVNVVVTLDLGKQVMLDEVVTIGTDISAIEALQEVAEIDNIYGGGFVASINGVRSGYTTVHTSKEDWFYYINGIRRTPVP